MKPKNQLRRKKASYFLKWQEKFNDAFDTAEIADKKQVIKTDLRCLIQWANANLQQFKGQGNDIHVWNTTEFYRKG